MFAIKLRCTAIVEKPHQICIAYERLLRRRRVLLLQQREVVKRHGGARSDDALAVVKRLRSELPEFRQYLPGAEPPDEHQEADEHEVSLANSERTGKL